MKKGIILLNRNSFPHEFREVNVEPTNQQTKEEYVENMLIDAINTYNPKLGVDRVEYLNISDQFKYCMSQKSNGLLVEEFNIVEAEREMYDNKGCYTIMVDNRCVCRRILMYLFISNSTEKSRNSFVSQTVFPSLLDYAELFLNSPSYSIANHEFCFINVVNSKMSSKMILRHLVSLYRAGIGYVEVFKKNTLDVSDIPVELKEIIRKYWEDFDTGYSRVTNLYSNNHVEIDFANKIFRWRVDSLKSKIVCDPSYSFKGSSEKFYWIEVLPISLYAYKMGFKIDYTEYENFIHEYRERFLRSSDKFRRCEVLLRYIKKFFI